MQGPRDPRAPAAPATPGMKNVEELHLRCRCWLRARGHARPNGADRGGHNRSRRLKQRSAASIRDPLDSLEVRTGWAIAERIQQALMV